LLPVIKRSIQNAKLLLVVIGPDWNRDGRLNVESDWIRQEITLALTHAIPILPVRVNGADHPTSLPKPLRGLLRRNGLEVRDNRWDVDVRQVIDATKLILSPELSDLHNRRRKALRVLLIHDLNQAEGDRAWEGRCRKLVSDCSNRWSGRSLTAAVDFLS